MANHLGAKFTRTLLSRRQSIAPTTKQNRF
jgi:hypothetical protein